MNDMTKEKQELWHFVVNKLPYATHMNPNCEYSEEEYEMAKEIIEPDFSQFKEQEHVLIIQTFACLIRSIKKSKLELDKWKERDFKEKGESWKQYHKMIPEFNRAMQSMVFENYKGRLKNGAMLFPVKRIIFEGDNPKDDEKVILEGPILNIIWAMFKGFDDVTSKEDQNRMKDFSYDLYDAYSKFMMEWAVANSEDATIGKSVKKNREETGKEGALKTIKYDISYTVHFALNGLTKEKSSAKYPSLNKRIIGKLLNKVDLFNFEGEYSTVFDKDIEYFIKMGHPENIGKPTRKQEGNK